MNIYKTLVDSLNIFLKNKNIYIFELIQKNSKDEIMKVYHFLNHLEALENECRLLKKMEVNYFETCKKAVKIIEVDFQTNEIETFIELKFVDGDKIDFLTLTPYNFLTDISFV